MRSLRCRSGRRLREMLALGRLELPANLLQKQLRGDCGREGCGATPEEASSLPQPQQGESLPPVVATLELSCSSSTTTGKSSAKRKPPEQPEDDVMAISDLEASSVDMLKKLVRRLSCNNVPRAPTKADLVACAWSALQAKDRQRNDSSALPSCEAEAEAAPAPPPEDVRRVQLRRSSKVARSGG